MVFIMRFTLIPVFTLLFVLLAPQSLQSQPIPHAIVKGRVLDDSTEAPLFLANVFISNSTIGAAADSAGRFELRKAPLGNQRIVASLVGYASQTIPLHVTDSAICTVEFRLKPRIVEIQGIEVQAKEPEGWKENLQRFMKEFLGAGPNAGQCRVLNPEVLDFTIAGKGVFTATAQLPLEIENKALGYHVRLFLDHFTLKKDLSTPVPATAVTQEEAYYEGGRYIKRIRPDPIIPKGTPTTMELLCRTHFTPLESGGDKERTQWDENRRKTYFGSLRHFLASLISNRSEREGFEVYELCQTRNPNFPIVTFNVDADTLVTRGDFSFERKLSFRNALQVTFRHEDDTWISFVRLSPPPVIIYINGVAAVPISLTTYGYWANQRVADMLPTDYTPDD
jgi:hypothetical protein